MSVVRRWIARIRSRARAAGFRARLLAGVAAALAAAGGLWLASDLAEPATVWREAAPSMAPAQVQAAVELARREGVAHRVDAGRLLVDRERLDEFRGLLGYEGLLEEPAVFDFDRLAKDSTIWSTPSQNARRWQAAKMAALSRLITHFPSVQRATVLFEPGAPRGLGRPALPPTAAVNVALREGAKMTGKLVAAIADQIAGSVGMVPQDVRIVDNAGRSHRVGPDGTVSDPIEAIREAEAHYRENIQAALHYIDGAIVGVSVTEPAPTGRCRSASVCVPRSYLAAAYRAATATPGDPNDAELEPFAAERLARIQRAVINVIGADDANAVKADWYYDVLPAAPVSAAAKDAAGQAGPVSLGQAGVSCVLILLGGLSGAAAYRRRRRRRDAAPSEPSDSAAQVPPVSADTGPSTPAEPLAQLRQMSSDALRLLVEAEHPQTIALVLSHVPAEAAAAVLGSFGRERQVEISRRIASLAVVDEEVVAEVLRGLLSRRTSDGEAEADSSRGAGKVAKILQHAGYATERTVLEALGDSEPALAESIRKRMFVFEDVALLPRRALRQALASLRSDELAVALRTASKDVTEKVQAGLTREALADVRTQMRQIGPVRLSDVEAAQERVVAAVRRLQDGRYVSAEAGEASELLA